MAERTIPTETAEQMVVVRYLRRGQLLFCHPNNEAGRGRRAGAKNKAMGVSKGAPDLFVFEPSGCGEYVGLAIELKRMKKGRVSKEQKQWLADLRQRGWRAEVCLGARAAIDMIKEHLRSG